MVGSIKQIVDTKVFIVTGNDMCYDIEEDVALGGFDFCFKFLSTNL